MKTIPASTPKISESLVGGGGTAECKICHDTALQAFTTLILNKYRVSFFKCNTCGFLFSENPYWLSEAYTKAISDTDTGILQRNLQLSQKVLCLLAMFFPKSSKILDWGGGYGIMVRLLRDKGLDAYWYDEYAQNIFAKSFEANMQSQYDLITSFEVFEHLPDPIATIDQMLQKSKNILFSTLPLPQDIPPYRGSGSWWYYGFSHGQHISFYERKTLAYIAKKYNLHYAHRGSIHFFSEKKINIILFKIVCILANKGLFRTTNMFNRLRIF